MLSTKLQHVLMGTDHICCDFCYTDVMISSDHVGRRLQGAEGPGREEAYPEDDGRKGRSRGLCLRPLCNVYDLLLSKNVDASASLVFRVRPASTWSQKNRSCRVRLTSAWWRSVISGERHKSSATMELSHVCRIQMRTFVW